MSDTPRTDEAVKQLLQTSQHERVKADFARELEREIAYLSAYNASLLWLKDQKKLQTTVTDDNVTQPLKQWKAS